MPVEVIGVVEVLEALKPVWQAHPETGRRLRGQIEAVLDAATARGLRAGPNPAAWKGNLKALLPARAAHQRAHHAALPYQDMANFMARLRAQDGIAAKALEFTILTAARTGEVRQATWAQLDLPNGVWTVPAAAMKANREHRVPLSTRALEILKALEAKRTSEFVFPSYDKGPLSTNAMLALLERMGHADITVHGFRSSFRDYAGEVSNAPHEVCEAALAHTVRNAAEAAYRRGDMIAKRRALMDSWAKWCEPKADSGSNVVALHSTASA
jgi:integrase